MTKNGQNHNGFIIIFNFRLIRYNAATKKNEVLVEDLAFANGVALSQNEDFVIVLETLTSRIIKYNLKGPKAGKQEIFADGLPGIPDNVHTDGQGNFLVSLVLYVDSQNPLLAQSIIPHPNIRKMFSRLLALLELPFKQLQLYCPNYYFERAIHYIGHFESMLFMSAPTVTVLRINEHGKIIDAMYTTDEKITGISSAYIHNGYLYLGSPWADSLARVPLSQALPNFSEPRAQQNKINTDKDTKKTAQNEGKSSSNKKN